MGGRFPLTGFAAPSNNLEMYEALDAQINSTKSQESKSRFLSKNPNTL